MRGLGKVVLLILLFELFSIGQEQPKQSAAVSARQLTFAEFETEMQRLDEGITSLKPNPDDAASFHSSIPDKYIVVGNGTSFSIENTVLKKSVGEYKIAYPERKADLLAAMQSSVKQMREGLFAYSQASDHGLERAKLAEVMSRKEFRRVTGPTLIDIWTEKAKIWILRILTKLFGNLPDPEQGSNVLTWILIAVATSLLAIWLVRNIRRKEVEYTREPILFAPSSTHWRTWLAQAQSSAENGNWRDAIHFAYWAGISNLEESGAWAPDKARTPREYLRIISPRDPNRPALSALTKKFEVVWYGEFPAAAGDYQETLQQLEALGCR
jgi:hypothetical protein